MLTSCNALEVGSMWNRLLFIVNENVSNEHKLARKDNQRLSDCDGFLDLNESKDVLIMQK